MRNLSYLVQFFIITLTYLIDIYNYSHHVKGFHSNIDILDAYNEAIKYSLLPF